MTAPKRPALRYHGGKWRVAPWIVEHLPPHDVYVEPFGGACSVLLLKPRSAAEVYVDLDGDVVNLFRVLREHPAALTRAVRWTPYARAEFDGAYARTTDPLERARRLLVRSWMGFGARGATSSHKTGFHSRTSGVGTIGATDWSALPTTLRAVARRMRGVLIECRPATAAIRQFDSPRTLFYCDPPYVAASRVDVTKGRYYRHEMTDRDHEKLVALLRGAAGMVLLSGYASTLYERLLRDWPRVERASRAYGSKPRQEILWFNPHAWDRLHDARTPLFAGARP